MNLTTLIFSKNRACQLDLLLRSLRLKVKKKNLRVLYTCDPQYKAAYDKVMKLYPNVEFILEEDFQRQVISSITDKYLLFLTDDEIMIDSFSEDCPEFLKFQANEDIICLNLRMAHNYDYDFLKDKQVPIPQFDDGMWKWKNYRHDWGYPMSVGSHIFRKKDILPILKTIEFTGPHMLERYMRGRLDKPLMIGFKKAKIVQIPVNRVASNIQRSSKFIPASFLNDKFMDGYIIDLKSIIKEAKKTRSYCMPVDFKLIKKQSSHSSMDQIVTWFSAKAYKTIIYYTSNRENPEMEQKIIDDMLSKAGNLPIISVSQKPLKLGQNICIGDVGHSYLNCRKQMLMATKLAKTEYVIHTESDVLYPPEYFNFEPTGDNLYRYFNVWVMWLKDKSRKDFYHKPDTFDGAMIVKRDFSIAELEKYLEPYPGWYIKNDRKYKPPHAAYHKIQKSYIPGENPCIHIKTNFGLTYLTGVDESPESTRKNLPYWGDVQTLRAKFS